MRLSLIITATLLLTALSVSAPAEAKVRWYSLNRGLALAQKQNKPILIDFYADWCHWCKVMERKTFSDPKVAAYLNRNFIAVRIDTERSGTIRFQGRNWSPREFLSALGGRGLPTVVFMSKKGELITRIPGFIDKKVFFPLLTYIKKECYQKTVPFDEAYISNQSRCK